MRAFHAFIFQVTEPRTSREPLRLRWVVPVLGIAQIISWGSLFYPIAVLGGAIRDDLGISDIAVFGAFTVGLFVSGLAAPAAGRLVDTRGGRFTLTSGSAIGALALAALALAQGTITLTIGFVLAGVAMAGVPVRPGVRDAPWNLGQRLSKGSHRADAVRRLREHRVLAAVPVPARFVWMAHDFRRYAVLNLLVCVPMHLGYFHRDRAKFRMAPRRGTQTSRSVPRARPCSAGSRHRSRWRRSCRPRFPRTSSAC
jgi:hypothetical protein